MVATIFKSLIDDDTSFSERKQSLASAMYSIRKEIQTSVTLPFHHAVFAVARLVKVVFNSFPVVIHHTYKQPNPSTPPTPIYLIITFERRYRIGDDDVVIGGGTKAFDESIAYESTQVVITRGCGNHSPGLNVNG